MVGRAVEWNACSDQAAQRIGQQSAGGVEDGRVIKARRARRWRRSAFAFPSIVKGAIDKDPRAVLGGVMDAVGMAEVVGSPATFAGRTAFRESIGEKIQEKTGNWLRERGVPVPQTLQDKGYDCLNKVFNRATDEVSERILNASPQARYAIENNKFGLF